MRLVGTFAPLSENDLPEDSFEVAANNAALKGQPMTDVQRVDPAEQLPFGMRDVPHQLWPCEPRSMGRCTHAARTDSYALA